jgi:hypothetical protein
MRFVGSSMRITSPGKCKKNGGPFGEPPSSGIQGDTSKKQQRSQRTALPRRTT